MHNEEGREMTCPDIVVYNICNADLKMKLFICQLHFMAQVFQDDGHY
jgi:hypothetical protein